MEKYTEEQKRELITEAKEKARKAGVSEDALSIIDSHSELPYQIGNIEDFLKLKDEDITDTSFWLWFTLDNE